uniref:F-box domain-containing protein n=1 Tax=Setaria viridis TaxID=4556 RepID=A0A4U6WGJ2_SETVI|nr:hypothetical protein SEVIR_1G307400v2 [Setaria viridis]
MAGGGSADGRARGGNPPPHAPDPASLVRAALVCKRWCRIISDPGFHHRYRELHRTPAMLGFLRNHGTVSSFVPTSSFSPPRAASRNFHVIDARHTTAASSSTVCLGS